MRIRHTQDLVLLTSVEWSMHGLNPLASCRLRGPVEPLAFEASSHQEPQTLKVQEGHCVG